MLTGEKKLSLSIVVKVTLCVIKFQRKRAFGMLKRMDFKFDKKEGRLPVASPQGASGYLITRSRGQTTGSRQHESSRLKTR